MREIAFDLQQVRVYAGAWRAGDYHCDCMDLAEEGALIVRCYAEERIPSAARRFIQIRLRIKEESPVA